MRGASVWACDVVEDEVVETARLCTEAGAATGGLCTARVVDVRDQRAVHDFVAEAAEGADETAALKAATTLAAST